MAKTINHERILASACEKFKLLFSVTVFTNLTIIKQSIRHLIFLTQIKQRSRFKEQHICLCVFFFFVNSFKVCFLSSPKSSQKLLKMTYLFRQNTYQQFKLDICTCFLWFHS